MLDFILEEENERQIFFDTHHIQLRRQLPYGVLGLDFSFALSTFHQLKCIRAGKHLDSVSVTQRKDIRRRTL